MGIKRDQFTFGSMNQDLSKSKVSKEFFFEGRNIRLVTTGEESLGAVTNQKGNSNVAQIPAISSDPTTKSLAASFPISDLQIIGSCKLNDDHILFTTNNTIDGIFRLEPDFTITLIYLDYLGFSTSNPIDAIGIYESSNLQKVYWVDGLNEVRYMNTVQTGLINLDKTLLSIVPDVELVEPLITNSFSGGSYTSGSIRYAYNQYSLNGAQTKISPISQTYYLNDGNKGSALDDLVSKSFEVSLLDLDDKYDFIKVYAIKYDSLDSTPKISLILDQASPTNLVFVDDGNLNITEISTSEFFFLGGDVVIPEHIVSKDNYLFFANFNQPSFDVDFDARAYRFNSIGQARLDDAVQGNLTINNPTDTVPDDHDAINPTNGVDEADSLFKDYRFKENGTTIGGEGPNVSYEIKYNSVSSNFASDSLIASDDTNLATNTQPYLLKTYKRFEIYRFGVEFIDNKGRPSFVKWIGDLQIPSFLDNNPMQDDGSLSYVYIEFTVNNIPAEAQGWRIVRVERTEADKRIVTQGAITATMTKEDDPAFDNMPGYFFRNKRELELIPTINSVSHGTILTSPTQDDNLYDRPIRLEHDAKLDSDWNAGDGGQYEVAGSGTINYKVDTNLLNMYTPEVIVNNTNSKFTTGDKVRILGTMKASTSTSYKNFFEDNGDESGRGEWSDTQPSAVLILNNRDGTTEDAKKQGKYISGNANSNGTPYNSKVNAYARRYSGLTTIMNTGISSSELEIDNKPIYVGPYQGTTLYESANSAPKVFRQDTIVNVDDFPGEYLKSLNASSILLQLLPTVYLEDDTVTPVLTGSNAEEYGILAEITRDVPNQYGGNTYEARQRNNYIPVSTFQKTAGSVDTYNGDTYIQKMNLLRNFKLENSTTYTAEVISFPVESSINLDLRYDLSANRLDNYDAAEESYYGFNHVYEQSNNLVKAIPEPPVFNNIEEFQSRIIATKPKILGETIDSFTDLSVNDILDLDTSHGAITAMHELNDEVFAFQRDGVAFISINPRVLIATSDGIPTELGSGGLLQEYKYITTNSGTLNKWSVTKSDAGLFYFDIQNKSLNFIQGQDIPISTVSGMYAYINNFTDANKAELLVDNPILNTGVHTTYDHNTKDVYFTFLTSGDKFTLAYNGLTQGFTSFYDFTPTHYINNNGVLLSTIDNTDIYLHNSGDKGSFYGVLYPSYVETHLNSEPDADKIFTNLMFASEVYDTNDAELQETMTKLQLSNEYQDSGLITPNFIRKFREWRVALPRESGSRNRIRGNWAKLKLEFTNVSNKKFILHDIILTYINP